ncbi:MAG: amino acid ABC transporter substrate-binding protein [Deltaproteobacteria bacterium]|nr:MAG: amino acid ABC transporter substrate-binding protein [Deltaproteobacteria bacterium]
MVVHHLGKLLLVGLLLMIGVLIVKEATTDYPAQLPVTTAGYVDMCLSCHADEELDPAHDARVLGCSPCHLGDAMARDKDKAHEGMVLNPGDLRVVHRTCGVEGCHPADVEKVKNSLMATNRGILATLLYYWGETDTQDADISVEQLLESGDTSLALDYYRKLCATCHLWQVKNSLPGLPAFFNAKGGGCSACHHVQPGGPSLATVDNVEVAEEASGDLAAKKPHPLITAKVPEENCIRCHNRSGRTGLSYIGIFESEGYGTPYEGGGLSHKRLPGNRFYLEIAEDVHHTKKMVCIDCHTREEIMGDGNRYAHYEEQMEISCESCHSEQPGITRKGRQLNNIDQEGERFVLRGKVNAVELEVKPPNPESCNFAGHERLSCESCHSTWVPQCYGCHVKRDAGEIDLDKLALKETPGWWEEGRSYIRYEKPMLAVWGEEVVIVTPGCQDVVTLVDEQGEIAGGFNRFTMAAINPHTTQAKGRSCKECHADPKTIGLGEGVVYKKDGRWHFDPVDRGVDTLEGRTVGLDNFVDIDGNPLQLGSRENLRPFTGEELRRILRIGLCLDCHHDSDDPAYRNYTPERTCPVFVEP